MGNHLCNQSSPLLQKQQQRQQPTQIFVFGIGKSSPVAQTSSSPPSVLPFSDASDKFDDDDVSTLKTTLVCFSVYALLQAIGQAESTPLMHASTLVTVSRDSTKLAISIREKSAS